jgi:transcriptional regulator with XRE-family HTH domain
MSSQNRVTEYRERKGLSKQKLSQLTGISPSNLYHIETGKIFPYPGWRIRLSKALDIAEEVLFPEFQKKEV